MTCRGRHLHWSGQKKLANGTWLGDFAEATGKRETLDEGGPCENRRKEQMREMLQRTQHGLETEYRTGRGALWRRQIKAISFDIIKTILLIHSSVNCAQNMSKQFNPIEFMTSFTFL